MHCSLCFSLKAKTFTRAFRCIVAHPGKLDETETNAIKTTRTKMEGKQFLNCAKSMLAVTYCTVHTIGHAIKINVTRIFGRSISVERRFAHGIFDAHVFCFIFSSSSICFSPHHVRKSTQKREKFDQIDDLGELGALT